MFMAREPLRIHDTHPERPFLFTGVRPLRLDTNCSRLFPRVCFRVWGRAGPGDERPIVNSSFPQEERFRVISLLSMYQHFFFFL